MRFVVRIENKNYPASLEFGQIYRVVPNGKVANHQMIRVIDESGEDYLYSQKSFVAIELPQLAEDAFMALARFYFNKKYRINLCDAFLYKTGV